MANFIISFRIHSDSTYQERYASFVQRVHEIGGGVGAVWEETSSFFALRAEGSADDLCDNLYFSTLFDASKDAMLVIDLGARRKAMKGKLSYPNTLTTCLGF